MQLISPSLPIGGFTYSQGLERAVDLGWVTDAAMLTQWLHEQVMTTVARLDLPVLIRLYDASNEQSLSRMIDWSRYLIASRETSELRAEEHNRGRALALLLKSLDIIQPGQWLEALELSQSAGFAYAASIWDIPKHNMLRGFAWSWVENLVLAGVKIVPLGQSDGQRILLKLAPVIVEAVELAQHLDDDEIGASSPALSIASSQHQFQYTRLFRS